MKNTLHRLRKLREDFVRERNFVDDLKTIAGESPSAQFRQLIDEAETKLANLQGELATLTGEVTKAVRLTLTETQMIVVLAHEVEGEAFASIARRLNRSIWRTRDLHKQGVKLLTAARWQSPPCPSKKTQVLPAAVPTAQAIDCPASG